MFRMNMRHRIFMLFAILALFGLATSSGRLSSAAHNSPGDCDFQNTGCLGACPVDPSTGQVEAWCSELCRNDHIACENSAFGASLTVDNFMLAVRVGCEKYYLSYRGNCINNNGMIPRHRPVYDACIASNFTVTECCTNIANDFANAISECTEF